MPNIYDAIKSDHATHRDLMKSINDSKIQTRGSLWKRFYEDVKSHAAAEEETFYATLISKTWGQDAARHSVHEHQQLDDLLEELKVIDMSSDLWLKEFEKLVHDYEHHMAEEENEVFARACDTIGENEIEGYGDRFETRKAKERSLIEKSAKTVSKTYRARLTTTKPGTFVPGLIPGTTRSLVRICL